MLKAALDDGGSSGKCAEIFTGIEYKFHTTAEIFSVTSRLCLLAAYLFVCFRTFQQLWKLQSKRPNTFSTHKCFLVLIILSVLARSITLPLPPHWSMSMSALFFFLVITTPGVLYFSSYMLLILFWAAVHRSAARKYDEHYQRRIFSYFILVNFSVVTLVVGIGMGLESNSDYGFYHVIICSALLLTLLSLILISGFLFYGFRVYWGLGGGLTTNASKRQLIRQVGSVTTICTLCFSAKVPAVFLLSAVLCPQVDQGHLTILGYEVIWLIFMICCELLPSSTVLHLLSRRSALSDPSTPSHDHGSTSEAFSAFPPPEQGDFVFTVTSYPPQNNLTDIPFLLTSSVSTSAPSPAHSSASLSPIRSPYTESSPSLSRTLSPGMVRTVSRSPATPSSALASPAHVDLHNIPPVRRYSNGQSFAGRSCEAPDCDHEDVEAIFNYPLHAPVSGSGFHAGLHQPFLHCSRSSSV